jgi:hypothetical protein
VNTAVHRLPVPSKAHATCACCEATLDTIVKLLEHVDTEHLPAAASRRLSTDHRRRPECTSTDCSPISSSRLRLAASSSRQPLAALASSELKAGGDARSHGPIILTDL